MSNEVKHYFLAPSWDYLPNGPISLGNIIVSPTRPVPPVCTAAKIETQGLITSNKRDIEWKRGKTRAHKFGIWMKFLEFLSINIGVDVSTESDEVFSFKSMHTEELFFDAKYIQAVLKSSPVAQHLLTKQRQPLYIIVGVKTVSEAAVKRSRSRAVAGSLGVSVDAALAGSPVPTSVGPSVETSLGTNESVSFGGSDDFVFAFRVQKLRLKRKEDEVRLEDHMKGAMFGYGDNGDESQGVVELGGHLDASDVTGVGFSDGIMVNDEDEEVQVIMPMVQGRE